MDSSVSVNSGLVRCPACGSTEVVVDGLDLRCAYCRNQWRARSHAEHTSEGLAELTGTHIGLGGANINRAASELVTIKCQGCGAEVVIHTCETLQSKCHWCRQTLSVNHQIPSGVVPDLILPFTVTRAEAAKAMRSEIRKHTIWAHPKFRRDFDESKVVGVYLPYVLMDGNFHIKLRGDAERSTGMTISDKRPVFTAEHHLVRREFDFTVDDLAVESAEHYLAYDGSPDYKLPRTLNPIDKVLNMATDAFNAAIARRSVNIINAIQPFDTENAVTFDANYMRGYTSERRDIDVDLLEPVATWQAASIAREQVRQTVRQYDRGVAWDLQEMGAYGTRWLTGYLPVWLYSYDWAEGDGRFRYYMATNGRTWETMSAVPTNRRPAYVLAAILGILGLALGVALSFFAFKYLWNVLWIVPVASVFFAILFPLFLVTWAMLSVSKKTVKYDKTHDFENETSFSMRNLVATDEHVGYSESHSKSVFERNEDRPRERITSSFTLDLTQDNPSTGD